MVSIIHTYCTYQTGGYTQQCYNNGNCSHLSKWVRLHAELEYWLDIRGSVHRSTIHKEKSNKMQQCINILLFHIYMKLNMFWATPPIIRSLKLHWQPLVFHMWKAVWTCSWWTWSGTVCAWQTTRPKSLPRMKNQRLPVQFRLLMMGIASPETCWASWKYGIIKFWYIVASCWIFLYELNHGNRNAENEIALKTWLIKTRGCQCSFRLLMMGGVSPETC